MTKLGIYFTPAALLDRLPLSEPFCHPGTTTRDVRKFELQPL